MAQASTFAEILKEQLGINDQHAPSSLPKEEDQALWVQVLPFIKPEKWEFKKASQYKSTPLKTASVGSADHKYEHKFTETAQETSNSFASQEAAQTQPPAGATPTPVSVSAPAPVTHPTLTLKDLDIVQVAQVELLVRGGWILRAESYSLNDWKKAHRKAVKALHPDQNQNTQASNFTEIHESFKSLRPLFK